MGFANKINVAIADDHRAVLHGLALVIEHSGFATITGIATSIKECISMLQQKSPDVLILNLGFPDGNSIDSIPSMKEICPSTKILIFTGCAEIAVINRALSSGADGYILKSSSIEELLSGIQYVTENEVFLCEKALEISKGGTLMEIPKLTKRERQILKLITEGYTIKEIADELYLGFETVRSYSKHIRLKMDVNNTALMVKKAIKQRLV